MKQLLYLSFCAAFKVVAFLSSLLLVSPSPGFCESQMAQAGLTSTPLRKALTKEKEGFTLLRSEDTGVSHTNTIEVSHELSSLYITGYGCGGAAAGDVNGDGTPDLFLVNGPGKNSLYLQVDTFRFKDISAEAGVEGGNAWGTGAAMADIDNDGDLDIYVCNYNSPAQLFLNNGSAKFTEEAKAYGLASSSACIMPSFGDFDRDGYLDVYMVNNRLIRKGGFPEGKIMRLQDGKPQLLAEYKDYYKLTQVGPRKYSLTSYGQADRLLRHNGSNERPRYIDVTKKAGISDLAMGLSAIWWDYNKDDFPDIYVANDFEAPDILWMNNGDGTFTDVLAESFPHTTWFSMGADTADVNNDGHWDLLAADMSGTTHYKRKLSMGSMNNERIERVAGPPPQLMRNTLLIGTGTGRFLESAYLSGLANSDWTWTVKLADLDNDGLVDVFFTNGITRDFMNSDLAAKGESYSGNTEWELFKNNPEHPERNLAFKNLGGLRFENTSHRWGLDELSMSYAAVHADFDRDGDLDLVVSNLQKPVSIYRNDHSSGNRVLIELRGTKSNSFGYGASVTINTKKAQQIRQLQPSGGFSSSNEPMLHFGLGEETRIESLSVRWPSGHTQRFSNLAAGHRYRITEPEGLPERKPDASPQIQESLFSKKNLLSEARHRETPFDDFARQPLLPNKLSQLGPGMAWGDIDQDEDEDLFLGGAAEQTASLFLNQGENGFERIKSSVFRKDRLSEDMGSLFFDVDSDGDLDLYVVSGGVEVNEEDPLLQDRLYLNDGKGGFSKAPRESLPTTQSSGSVVAAADFDRDGDLDLFIGGRVIPGRYPLSPKSLLLRNDTLKGGTPRLVDVTEKLATGLKEVGMVTSALWSDATGDGLVDLLLTLEWGSVMLWKNNSGVLQNITDYAKLSKNTGWFNAISGRDLDNDGDIDYVVTNFGLNTKYHASAETPVLMYYGRFKGNEKNRIIEAEYEDETLYPVRGKGCSTRAISELAQDFSTYSDFAQASLEQIYSPSNLSSARKFTSTMLESSVLINDGKGRFEFRSLPDLAQISPAFGTIATEIDGDGYPDIYLVQNFYTPQIETGRMDSGLSLLLLGTKNLSFSPLWPEQSGLIVPGDAKSLASLDLNNDARVDFAVGVNNDALQIFQQKEVGDNHFFAVQLRGHPGNLNAVGSMVDLVRSDGIRQRAEVYAGSGYLSQSSPRLFFGLGTSAKAQQVIIRWPDGNRQIITDPPDNYLLVSEKK